MRITSFIIAAVIFISCGGNPDKKDKTLASLISSRDSLKKVQKEINEKLKVVEEKISFKGESSGKKRTLVSTEIVNPEKFAHYFEAHGTIACDYSVQISAEIAGLIRSIKVREGEKIAAGQILIELDTDVISKNIQEVEIALDLAKTVYAKQQRLWKQQIGSEIQYLEAKTKLESLEQKLKTLQAQEQMGWIKAPFSGVVDQIFAKQGEMALPQSPLIRLIDLNEVYVESEISERYLKSVQPGTEVLVNFPSLDLNIPSSVKRTGNYINPNNRTFRVRVDLENSSEILRPNMLANLMIKDFEADSALALSSGVVQQDARGNNFLFIANNVNGEYKAEKVMVQTGLSYKGKTIITGGLEGGEEVIVLGGRSLKDGEEITIKN